MKNKLMYGMIVSLIRKFFSEISIAAFQAAAAAFFESTRF